MKNESVVTLQVRLPRETHQRLKELKRRKPHMSINALVVEMLESNTLFDVSKSQIDLSALSDPSLVEKLR